jgi:hypothetical protein
MAWVDAETVTSLIEAHGASRDAVLRPRYEGETGWPALIPISALGTLSNQSATAMPDELLAGLAAAGFELRPIDTGDPGTAFDIGTSIDQMPRYQGPPEPVAGHAPEWGAAAADMSDDSPLEGPAVAPYGQAADPDSD